MKLILNTFWSKSFIFNKVPTSWNFGSVLQLNTYCLGSDSLVGLVWEKLPATPGIPMHIATSGWHPGLLLKGKGLDLKWWDESPAFPTGVILECCSSWLDGWSEQTGSASCGCSLFSSGQLLWGFKCSEGGVSGHSQTLHPGPLFSGCYWNALAAPA